MGSTNQLVQRPAAGRGESACILSCSCVTLTSNEPLEIAVPWFAAFMEDEKRKGEEKERFGGLKLPAPCFIHPPVYRRERDDSAAVE